ncbi:hypothetical protein B0T24DRAFT_602006 [Lasiosphaeria ovina]|uniref:Secreted protein n=1 Tax=Lasiosphaeria ovina TaxID=92902 RepID=A0AAE0NJA8_9PEZI|nr:hypothetical protein B0T24DRAFT_602006 [Lasiosphaeria ovina]
MMACLGEGVCCAVLLFQLELLSADVFLVSVCCVREGDPSIMHYEGGLFNWAIKWEYNYRRKIENREVQRHHTTLNTQLTELRGTPRSGQNKINYGQAMHS